MLEHADSGRQRVIRCRATSAARCKPCSETYRRRVRRVALSGQERRRPSESIVMLTLTAPSEVDQHCAIHRKCDARQKPSCDPCQCTPPGGVHMGEWNGACSTRFNKFMTDLRRQQRMRIEYFKAAEVQHRGALHFHVLMRIPAGREAVFSVAYLRSVAIRHGFGHSIDLSPGIEPALASYVAKYASKSCTDREDMPWVHRLTGEVSGGNGRYRVWTASRGWGITMAELRAAQAAWWANQGTAGEPAQPATAGPLDPSSQSYAEGEVLPWAP